MTSKNGSRINVRTIAILSMLVSLSVVGRIAFTFLPNVQPTTSIIIITAILLGPLSGVIVAVLSAMLSNLIMGMGIWTLSQIICWGIIGLLAGWLGKKKEMRFFYIIAIIFSVLSGYLYGFFISLPMFVITDYGWMYYVAGIPFDTMHAIGNGVFFTVLYPVLTMVFERYKKND